jgi:hypothetical protein
MMYAPAERYSTSGGRSMEPVRCAISPSKLLPLLDLGCVPGEDLVCLAHLWGSFQGCANDGVRDPLFERLTPATHTPPCGLVFGV